MAIILMKRMEGGKRMGVFHCPTTIWSGANALDKLSSFRRRKVFVVTDRYFSESGKALEIGRRVPDSEVRIFDRVRPDPSVGLAAEGAAQCKAFLPDLMIALGGGSALDCAKAIRFAAGIPMDFVAIPTTSGSGAEMTSYSILTHGSVKYPLVNSSLRPDYAILDDSLLSEIPRQLIADTGMDLLAHSLEALAATNRTCFTDALAFYAATTVMAHLPASFRGDCSVRGILHEAASMAGLAFDHAGLGVCHGLAHAMGGAFHIPHGRLCAILLPAVMEYNKPAVQDRYAMLARFCGCQTTADHSAFRYLVSSIRQLRRKLQLPDNLKEAGVTKAQWAEKKQEILQAAWNDPCCKTNPVDVTEAGLETICLEVAP